VWRLMPRPPDRDDRYADGSTQAFTIGFQNWIYATPVDGDALVATTSYFNRTRAGKARTPSSSLRSCPAEHADCRLRDAADVSSAKVSGTVASMHIFAIGFS